MESLNNGERKEIYKLGNEWVGKVGKNWPHDHFLGGQSRKNCGQNKGARFVWPGRIAWLQEADWPLSPEGKGGGQRHNRIERGELQWIGV